MKHLFRLAFNAATALSTAAFALVLVFWVRSHSTENEFSAGRFRVYSILSRNGSLHGVVDFRSDVDGPEPMLAEGEPRLPVTSGRLVAEDSRFRFEAFDTTARSDFTFKGTRMPANWWGLFFGDTSRWEFVVPDWAAGLATALPPGIWGILRFAFGRRVLGGVRYGTMQLCRIGFNSVAGASPLLCLATAALWGPWTWRKLL